MEAINVLKQKFGGSRWLANEKDESFRVALAKSTRPSEAQISILLWKKR